MRCKIKQTGFKDREFSTFFNHMIHSTKLKIMKSIHVKTKEREKRQNIERKTTQENKQFVMKD
jgi:hypothetical protein